jgi:long-chain acyl-CoA synthetase
MIIRSGLKVYPIKVEKVIRGHEGVADVAVVGRDDPGHTHVVVAVVVPKEKVEDAGKLKAELRTLCRQHLAPYEVPGVIEFAEALPRSGLGKLLKRDLRKGATRGEAANEESKPSNGEEAS